jgi:hypothetical protein
VAGTTAIKKDRFETDSDGDFLNSCRPKMGRVSQSIAAESPGVRGLQASGSVREVLQKPLRRMVMVCDVAITGSFGEDAHHDQETG